MRGAQLFDRDIGGARGLLELVERADRVGAQLAGVRLGQDVAQAGQKLQQRRGGGEQRRGAGRRQVDLGRRCRRRCGCGRRPGRGRRAAGRDDRGLAGAGRWRWGRAAASRDGADDRAVAVFGFGERIFGRYGVPSFRRSCPAVARPSPSVQNRLFRFFNVGVEERSMLRATDTMTILAER